METTLFAGSASSAAANKILPLRQQAEVRNRWLMRRLESILPEIMQRESIDMWCVISREYNEDPVIMSLLPEPMMHARRRTILLFFRRDDGSVERLVLSRYGLGEFYEAAWNPEEEDQWECLGRLARERQPKSIGVNSSATFAFGDGLTHTEHELLHQALGADLAENTKSAERLCVGWLERRLPEEIDAYAGIAEITHAIVKDAFSSMLIHPGVTTCDDVVWWMRERMKQLGLRPWFQPSVSIQAPGQMAVGPASSAKEARKLILPGDLLHCDVGMMYLGLATDVQQHAYVLRLGEDSVPEGLVSALADANRFQDICCEEFITGRTGNEILKAALSRAQQESIRASLYTHPLGYHGHAAGPTIGLWDNQQAVHGPGDYELFEDTCYALELNITKAVPEWGGQDVRIALEQDVLFRQGKVHFLAGRQQQFHLVR